MISANAFVPHPSTPAMTTSGKRRNVIAASSVVVSFEEEMEEVGGGLAPTDLTVSLELSMETLCQDPTVANNFKMTSNDKVTKENWLIRQFLLALHRIGNFIIKLFGYCPRVTFRSVSTAVFKTTPFHYEHGYLYAIIFLPLYCM